MQQVRYVDLGVDMFGPMRMRRRRDFEVQGAGYFEASDEVLAAPWAVVDEASLTSLRHAVARYLRHVDANEEPIEMLVSEDAPEVFDAEDSVYLSVRLCVSADAVGILVETETPDMLDSSEPVSQLLRPLLSSRRATLTHVTRIDGVRGAAVQVHVDVATRGRTVGDALSIGEDVERLLDAAFATGPLRAPTAAELLRTGHHEVLVGQPETGWLDAKDRLYELNEVGRFQLARDIASFANAAGGVIAVGLSTSRVRGDDVISRVRPVPLDGFSVAAHRAVVRDWIYPRPQNARFDVSVISSSPERGLLVIEVPEQPSALKPFFVRRAELGERLRTEHYALPVRLADATSYFDLAELHALIVAGRAALASTPDA